MAEKPDLRPEKADFRPERADFRSERAWGGIDRWTDGRNDEQTDGMTNESPPVFYRTSSPSGPLPKNQSPKGNMWSAIPVALLNMFVTEGDG